MVDNPRDTSPVDSSWSTVGELAGAGTSGIAREPIRLGNPSTAVIALMYVGTPANTPLKAPDARSRARSASGMVTAFSCGFTFSVRASAASTSSLDDTSPDAIISASATASWSPSASSPNA